MIKTLWKADNSRLTKFFYSYRKTKQFYNEDLNILEPIFAVNDGKRI